MHVPRATLAIYFHKEIKLDSLIALRVITVGIYIGSSLSGGKTCEGTSPCSGQAVNVLPWRVQGSPASSSCSTVPLAPGHAACCCSVSCGDSRGAVRTCTTGTTHPRSVGNTALGRKLVGKGRASFLRKMAFQK